MPQILKNDVKNRIIEAAKEEFMENTYEKTSMRTIAARSKITVGNLYRYFRNKEELNKFIVQPALTKIQDLILQITNNQVDILNTEEISLTSDQMRSMLDTLGDGVVDIYSQHRIEVNILMMNSSLHRYLISWFSDAIRSIISHNYNIFKDSNSLKLMADVYAEAIFSGFITMLRNSKVSYDELKKLVKLYMESYVDMLDVDFKSVLEG
ncbi:MAG: TetR/AcrR family transcriptional regulator [Erysipelotrichaceae bacterium]|nr:TetR/AcrR family transcriptional regulator [Erysipelotrichaceae bacterium]